MWFTQGLDAAHAKREKAELTYLAAMAKSSLGLRKRKTTKFKKPSSKHKEVQALLNQPEDVMAFLDGQEQDALEVALQDIDTHDVQDDCISEVNDTDEHDEHDEDTFEEI